MATWRTALVLVMMSAVTMAPTPYDRSEEGLTNFPLDIPEGTIVIRLLNNRISTLNHSLPTSVTMLDLQNNMITSVPDYTFSKQSQLTNVYLNKNRISWVGPHAFAGTRMRYLNLGVNFLVTVPDLRDIKETLSTLRIHYNSIAEVPVSVIDGFTLDYLSLHENKLKYFPDPRGHDSTIRDLRLGLNPLSCDCRLSWIKDAQTSGWMIIDLDDAPCAEPVDLVGRNWTDIQAADLTCPDTTPGGEITLTVNQEPVTIASPSTPPQDGTTSGNLNIGAWIGIVVAVVAATCIASITVCLVMKHRKTSKQQSTHDAPSAYYGPQSENRYDYIDETIKAGGDYQDRSRDKQGSRDLGYMQPVQLYTGLNPSTLSEDDKPIYQNLTK